MKIRSLIGNDRRKLRPPLLTISDIDKRLNSIIWYTSSFKGSKEIKGVQTETIIYFVHSSVPQQNAQLKLSNSVLKTVNFGPFG